MSSAVNRARNDGPEAVAATDNELASASARLWPRLPARARIAEVQDATLAEVQSWLLEARNQDLHRRAVE